MRGVNKAIIVGHLGQDPEVRYTPGGSAVCEISVATSRAWKDKNSGEQQEHTEWHKVVLWGKQAEIAGEYLKKGSPVFIEGEIRTEKWQDKEGKDRYTTKIHAQQMQLIGGREKEPHKTQRGSLPDTPSKAESPDFDDEIPFN